MAKKTQTPTKPAKPATNEVQLSDLTEGDMVELTVRWRFGDTHNNGIFAGFTDCEGDDLTVVCSDIMSIRMAPKPIAQVTGPDAERAAKILRDAGFTVD
jgi:hypothetical protein